MLNMYAKKVGYGGRSHIKAKVTAKERGVEKREKDF